MPKVVTSHIRTCIFLYINSLLPLPIILYTFPTKLTHNPIHPTLLTQLIQHNQCIATRCILQYLSLQIHLLLVRTHPHIEHNRLHFKFKIPIQTTCTYNFVFLHTAHST